MQTQPYKEFPSVRHEQRNSRMVRVHMLRFLKPLILICAERLQSSDYSRWTKLGSAGNKILTNESVEDRKGGGGGDTYPAVSCGT